MRLALAVSANGSYLAKCPHYVSNLYWGEYGGVVCPNIDFAFGVRADKSQLSCSSEIAQLLTHSFHSRDNYHGQAL